MARPGTKRVCILIVVFVGFLVGSRVLFNWPSAPVSGESDARPHSRSPEDRKAARAQKPPVQSAISAQIRNSVQAFRNNSDPRQAATILDDLRVGIRQAPESDAAAAIVGFLKTEDDAPTGLAFVVGPEGMMETVPSVRLALLDLLPSLDPVAALEVARELMDRRTSADEYAVALRNMAWNDLDGDLRGELSRRFMALLQMPWLDQPSAGFIEAFDIAVEVGGSAMFDRMVSLAGEATEKSNTAASRAAFMSLDRMIVRDRALLATAFSADAAWMDFAPQQRASLMSRLDIMVPAQRDVFLRYISDNGRAADELEYFGKLFPNENFLYGHRLVTADEVTPSIDQVTAADARVLVELDALEPAIPEKAKSAVEMIRRRLKSAASP